MIQELLLKKKNCFTGVQALALIMLFKGKEGGCVWDNT